MSDRPMRVVIVQPHAGSSQETFEALEEAEGLVEAVQGWRVIGSEIIKVKRPGSRTYLGDGQCAKLGEVINTLAGGGELQEEGRAKEDALAEAEAEWDETEKERLEEELGPCSVFVNTKSLAPHQQQHLQDEWGVPVLDRFMVVLQIFKNRATSAEATIQLELAELAFRRSRLSASDAGYSQQRGGTATRGGGGEQQIELSRRTLLRRETLLKKELARAVESRAKRGSVIREREINLGSRLSRVALVGYTNAGKSLLHQRLTALAPKHSSKTMRRWSPASFHTPGTSARRAVCVARYMHARGAPAGSERGALCRHCRLHQGPCAQYAPLAAISDGKLCTSGRVCHFWQHSRARPFRSLSMAKVA